MANNRPQIRYGASGDDVKELQRQLNANGFSLTVDGIWGDQTEAAVRKYQKQNGLSVDGIVGEKTWGSLLGGGKIEASSTPKFEYDPFEYSSYKEGDSVIQAGKQKADAEAALNNHGDFIYGNQEMYDSVFDKIMNREDFSYDLNGDALYQQYKDKYIQQGKMAMQDTMGQAAAMTGGYGNSYAATVGNQAYQASLENLNDIVPELYQMAYDKYNQEGQDLYNQYAMLSDDRNAQYGMHMDEYNQLAADRDYYANAYDNERTYDYNKYAAERDFSYGQYSDDKSYAYQTHRDAIADEQWKREFDEAQRQFNEQQALTREQWEWSKANANTGGGSSGGSGSSGGGGGSSKLPTVSGGSNDDKAGSGFTYVDNKTTTDFIAGCVTRSEFGTRGATYNGKKYTKYEDYIDAKISDALNSGKLTENEAASIMSDLGLL